MDGYFDDDDDHVASSNSSNFNNKRAAPNQEEEVDPLDAFMMGVENTLKEEPSSNAAVRSEVLMQDEEEDHMEGFLAYREENEILPSEQDFVDEDGKQIDLNTLDLAPLDHSAIVYDVFKKNVFVPVPGQTIVDKEAADAYRKQHDIRVRVDQGIEVPPVAPTIAGFGLSRTLTNLLQKQFAAPTAIQSQTVTAALCGNDIIGIAKTGSGKTGAFLWPVIHHLCNWAAPKDRGSPYAIVVAPTRELAKQIYDQCREWARPFNFNVVNMFGGAGTMTQITALREVCEIVVGTPGRIIHFMKKKYLKPINVRFLCLDEADKMLDMGFETQVRSICGQLRPDRQTTMFSATFRPNVQRLASDLLIHPIRINVGKIGAVNKDIDQIPIVLSDDSQKQMWLLAKLPQFVKDGSVLVFVGQKQNADAVAALLVAKGFQAASTHGEKGQQERHKIHFAFKNGNLPILVATDVASRGLDIGTVKTVIQYDAPKSLEVHTHRVGRTGRAGMRGSAYALVVEPKFAHIVAKSMKQGDQLIPPDLLALSQRYKGRRRDEKDEYDDEDDEDGERKHDGSAPDNRRRDKSEKVANWNNAKNRHLSYAQGAGLGAEKTKRRKEDHSLQNDDYSLGAAFSEFRNNFVPAKKE